MTEPASTYPCGHPVPPPGTALLCGGPAGGTRLTFPPPAVCPHRDCAAKRDAAAIQHAIDTGLIDP